MTESSRKPRVFSGVKPTGNLTLGNYLGALKNWVDSQYDSDPIFCVVNDHAITIRIDPQELRQNTQNVAAAYLACGLDPQHCILFVQTDVEEHTTLAWMLNSVTYYGELHRMTQFKDKTANQKTESVSAGLLNYPILMAADILLYDTEQVPVGEDQKQHVELCRDVAIRWNSLFGQTFVVPEPVIAKAGARVMSLDDPMRKMEKSNPNANSYILLTDPKDVIAKKFARAVTDSGSEVRAAPEKPALTNLLTIYSLLSKKPIAQLEEDYAGKQYGVFKKDLAEVVIDALAPIAEKMSAYIDDRTQLRKILENGAQRARERARIKVDLAKERIGLKWR